MLVVCLTFEITHHNDAAKMVARSSIVLLFSPFVAIVNL